MYVCVYLCTCVRVSAYARAYARTYAHMRIECTRAVVPECMCVCVQTCPVEKIMVALFEKTRGLLRQDFPPLPASGRFIGLKKKFSAPGLSSAQVRIVATFFNETLSFLHRGSPRMKGE